MPTRSRFVSVWLIAALLFALFGAVRPVQADPGELFFSEYIEGTSNNKALEIFNGTPAPIDLAANSYNVRMFFNGSPTPGLTINLTGTVAAGDVFVLAQSAASAAILAQADQTSSASWFNGDDAVALYKGNDPIDIIGQVGVDPGTEWGSGLASTADNTLRRKAAVEVGDLDGSDAFDPAVQWDGFATDSFDGLGTHQFVKLDGPVVVSTFPVDGDASVQPNVTLEITFNEAVTVTGDWVVITCDLGMDQQVFKPSSDSMAVTSSDQTTYSLNLSENIWFGSSCGVLIDPTLVSAADDDAPMEDAHTFGFTILQEIFTCDAPATPIYEIQGSGLSSPLAGQAVWVEGAVIGFRQESGSTRGYYLQAEQGDDDPATSDGIYVYDTAHGNTLSIGMRVRLHATVDEYVWGYTGCTEGLTELRSVDYLTSCEASGVTWIADLPLPMPPDADPATYWERYEGMRVQVNQPLTVRQNYYQARYGQLTVGLGRGFQPYNFSAYSGENRWQEPWRSALVLDDGSNVQNPSVTPLYPSNGALRAGDVLYGSADFADPAPIAGILDQGMITSTRGDGVCGTLPQVFYRFSPITPVVTQAANPRVDVPPQVGPLTVASFNVLNYFTTLDNGSYPPGSPYGGIVTPRGANNNTELERQQDKLVDALARLDADVVGLIEIEAWDGARATENLVEALNGYIDPAVPTYAVAADPLTDFSSPLEPDVIQQSFLYKPGAVEPVGTYLEPGNSIFDRQPLAQLFERTSNGQRFWVVVNHFKSKGSCPVGGLDSDLIGQGCWNARRVQQAQALLAWVQSTLLPVDPDVLVMGDLNSYGQEDPVLALTAGGLADQLARYVPEAQRYSYVFDGQSGYLDHGLATRHMALYVTGAAFWHINADEPALIDYNTEFRGYSSYPPDLWRDDLFRSSDHDPVLIGIDPQPPVVLPFVSR